jgi:hypothetical protein
MQKYSEFDFSKHQLKIEHYEHITIHTLQTSENSSIFKVRFMNIPSHLIIDGDFGSWMFCRNFYPNGKYDDYCQPSYWMEKLRMNSSQDPAEFDKDETEKELLEGINGGLEEYGYKGNELKEAISFFKFLQIYLDNEIEYKYMAFIEHIPSFMDCEQIPYVRTASPQLNIVFDAFNEICNRLKQNKDNDGNSNTTEQIS